MIQIISFFKADTPECRAEECWCVSAGGYNCGYSEDELCDPDQCWDKFDCPGYGYWCDNSGNHFTLRLITIYDQAENNKLNT